jgi:hypothetical protein
MNNNNKAISIIEPIGNPYVHQQNPRPNVRQPASIDVSGSGISGIYSIKKPRAVPLMSEDGVVNLGGSVPRKPKRRGPLLVSKASERFPSLERSVRNQSDLAMKLPDIRAGRRDDGYEMSLNYAEQRKAKLRAKLEALYQVKVP